MKREESLNPITPRAIALGGIAVTWLTLVLNRGNVISLRCRDLPESCASASLWLFDQAFLSYSFPRADLLSYWTQNLSAVFYLVVAWWAAGPDSQRRAYWTLAGLFGTCLNGLITEAIRLVVQRPRPFVYLEPYLEGGDPAHYTSFVSGHTSFSTMACVLALLLCRLEKRNLRAVLPIAALLPIATGVFRVLAGRHFPTDVIAGAFAGTCVALATAAWFAPKSRLGSAE